ncbi:TniQ family protein [Chromobacterium violaceum]|uniref:TniQ family protein n=1 Tax=Chromobacterium violaceum TaxID=536 RepID=UPI001E4802DE|nr:TniQ family protein [Chromobacterium violaceum]MCD0492025.1 TniQ family protein [Chromobacterium violaceum]
MLPMHPQPRPGEILSSWLVRLAFANGFMLHTFYDKLLGYRTPIWSRDIDRDPPLALLTLLARHTGHSVAELQALTLLSYQGQLFEWPATGHWSWVRPVGVYHRQRKRPGMQFCPLCLARPPEAYYRLPWRLALYVVCEHHQCVMEECCPACHTPIAFHRHGIGRRKTIDDQALRLCSRCHFDLASMNPVFYAWPDPPSWQQLRHLIAAIEHSTWDCGLLTPPCSLPFFIGVRALIGVLSGRNGRQLRQHLGNALGVEIPWHTPGQHDEFEYQSPTERLILLLAVAWLLEDWPARFLSLCAQAHFTRSRLAEHVDQLPFWLASVADTHLDQRRYLPNAAEIQSAGHYLQAHGLEVTPRALVNRLGLTPDCKHLVWKLWESNEAIR